MKYQKGELPRVPGFYYTRRVNGSTTGEVCVVRLGPHGEIFRHATWAPKRGDGGYEWAGPIAEPDVTEVN